MSRMTKFLKQTCTFEKALRNNDGTVQLDKYGEIVYSSSKKLKCRREKVIKDVQTSTGAILSSSTRYFTDSSQAINPDDKFDGKVILEVSEYINSQGLSEGYESYV